MDQDRAIIQAATRIVEAMLDGAETEESSLVKLASLCVEHDFCPTLLLFYRMKLALDELPILAEVDRNWRGGTREDIFADFRAAAKSWLNDPHAMREP